MTTNLLFPDEAKPPVFASVFSTVADVAVPVPVDRPFTYAVPRHLEGKVRPGARVSVPFGPRQLLGVVIEVRGKRDDDSAKIKPVAALVDADPVLPAELLAFLREVASYYLAPLGEVLSLAVPAVERRAMKKLREAGALPDKAKVAP